MLRCTGYSKIDNDYEGIRGYERYRDDLVLMYFADLDATGGCLQALELIPLQIRNFSLRSGTAGHRMDPADTGSGVSKLRNKTHLVPKGSL
jgi:hypothetical protein